MLSRRSVLMAPLFAARNPFFLSVLVDFPDDAEQAVYTPARLDSMMSWFAKMGIRRVYWIHYGDESTEGFWKPYGDKYDANLQGTIRALQQPVRVAAQAAHRHGLEIYGYFKPYETGISMIYPEGSPEGKRYGQVPHLGSTVPCVMKPVREHPEWRIRRRSDDLPAGVDKLPVNEIRLYKTDTKPTRIAKEHLQIWTSEANYRYARLPVSYDFKDAVEPAPHAFEDREGRVIAAKGAPVRVLTLSGLNLHNRCILVTTDFEDERSDFEISAPDMLQVFSSGRRIPIVTGAGGTVNGQSSVWCGDKIDFRNWGVEFDNGFGKTVVKLDVPNRQGKLGWVGFMRGRNQYLPAALCESYPQVQRFWLEQVDAILEAGVDGIDFRVENHCTHTDDPFAYGWNDVVVANAGNEAKSISRYRGQQYTGFLRKARQRIHARGKKMQLHVNVEFMRPDPRPSRRLAYPWNIDFDWRGWLREGLADEVTLRNFQYTPEFVLNDAFSKEVIAECERRKVPIHYNRYMSVPEKPAADYVKDLERIYGDGRFRSFIVYESSSFLFPEGEGVAPKYGIFEAVRDKAKELGLRVAP
jgi:hypothetical protein